MVTIPGLENINFALYVGHIFYWMTYGIIGLLVIVGFVAAYYYLTFKIKATVYPLYGSGKDGVFSIGKPKTNRVKWVKKHTAWQSMFPLFNAKDREPFDDEYMYPGKKIYVFELNDQWFPGRVNVHHTEGQIRGEISPVPYYIRNWQSIEHQKNAIEFSKHTFWDDNKILIMAVIACGLCLTLCGVTIYFAFQFAGGGIGAMNKLTDAINGITNIPGKPLG
jgi:hypothetical protein